MAGLQPSLYSIALALCVFCSGLLSQRLTRTGRPLRIFTLYLGFEALGFALELLTAHPATPYKSLWLGLLLVTSLLTAPLLWLALRETVTGETPRLRDLAWPHFAVIAVGVLCALPVIANAHAGTTWANPASPSRPWHYAYLHEAMLICIGLFTLQAPYYLRRTRELLRRATPSPGRAWLHLPVIIVATTWGLAILRTAQCATHAPVEWVALFALVDVSVTVGALYLIVRREFHPLADVSTAPTEATALPCKYAKSALESAHVDRIRRKLDSAFADQRLHHDCQLNLRTLSRIIGEKPHYVSQTINQALGSTFYDLINLRRIEDARQRLREEPNTTVLEIALAVGFNAKSTFNTAFKRHTGQTPSAYRRQTD
ncbi:AraC family transcriptional regulator [Actomonas aquatica]|uniref:Helix-turn-helix domain-containing protein n=1 Tax=Actomonas aquatica TaxID=2866162 RepID=A0ABZ1C7D4_9BACT|nr:helix-turn-helix domain-containing protein [Opitutus sp. WL0086]WRQ87333.1 helix-turn-helix domain-containing protein [Opitutus sp. WL0086]